jgi:hypothetical protein
LGGGQRVRAARRKCQWFNSYLLWVVVARMAGVNAGHYARELMWNCAEFARKGEDNFDPKSVLVKAAGQTKAKGTAAAVIASVYDQVVIFFGGESGTQENSVIRMLQRCEEGKSRVFIFLFIGLYVHRKLFSKASRTLA